MNRYYLFVYAKHGDKTAPYLENWWTKIDVGENLTGVDYDLEVWRSNRVDSDASYDAEIALGRLASGLITAGVVEVEDGTLRAPGVGPFFAEALRAAVTQWQYLDLRTIVAEVTALVATQQPVPSADA